MFEKWQRGDPPRRIRIVAHKCCTGGYHDSGRRKRGIAASVLVNASTRLSGGGDYEPGAVVGISTGKVHVRGPVGPEELTSYKWVARGKDHLRN